MAYPGYLLCLPGFLGHFVLNLSDTKETRLSGHKPTIGALCHLLTSPLEDFRLR